MKKRTNKGFSLTELIIVIVIIGILAAVLIPTLSSCVKRAKISNDRQSVRNLNTALVNNRIASLDNELHPNMTEALKAAFDAGYDVGKINATKMDNEILWDSENDLFCYYNDGTIEYIPEFQPLVSISQSEYYKYFAIKDVEESNLTANPTSDHDRFSVYAKSSTVSEIIINRGFDAGQCTNIEKVTYEREASGEHTVIIFTNDYATDLVINAPSDKVKHFGDVGNIDIIAIGSSSFHENGNAAFIEFAKGRLALEATAKVNQIHINKKIESFDENGDKQKAASIFDEVILAVDQNINIEDILVTRDDVEIGSEGIKVIALQNGTEEVTEETELDYIWLTKQGIYEQIVVSDNSETLTLKNTDVKVWADDENNSEKTQNAAQQIANNIGRDSENNIDVKLTVTKEADTKTYKVTLDEERNLIVVDESDADETPIASVEATGTITVNEVEFTIELSSSDNQMNLVATNNIDSSEVYSETVLEEAGLTSNDIEVAKEESVNDAIEFSMSFENEVYEMQLDTNNAYVSLNVEPILSATDAKYYADFNEKAEWSSSNQEVATVANGIITGAAGGEATITVTYRGVSASFTVSVPVQSEPFTVTFDTKYYNVNVASQQFNAPGKVTKPSDPEKEGYLFRGWFADYELTIPFDFENTTVSEDTTIYALWRVPVGGTIFYIHEEAVGNYTFYKGTSVTDCVVTNDSADFEVGLGGDLNLFVEVTGKPKDAIDKYFVYDSTNGVFPQKWHGIGYNNGSAVVTVASFSPLSGKHGLGDGKYITNYMFNANTKNCKWPQYLMKTNSNEDITIFEYVDVLNGWGNSQYFENGYLGNFEQHITQKPQYCDEWYIGSSAEYEELRKSGLIIWENDSSINNYYKWLLSSDFRIYNASSGGWDVDGYTWSNAATGAYNATYSTVGTRSF